MTNEKKKKEDKKKVVLTEQQKFVLMFLEQGFKPVDIQHQLKMKYINSVYQIINSLKVKGLITNEK